MMKINAHNIFNTFKFKQTTKNNPPPPQQYIKTAIVDRKLAPISA